MFYLKSINKNINLCFHNTIANYHIKLIYVILYSYFEKVGQIMREWLMKYSNAF